MLSAMLTPEQRWPRGSWNDLHSAAYDGCIQRTVALLSRGSVDINQRSPDGSTPLILGAGRGNSSIVRILLTRGANTSIADAEGFTALLASAQRGCLAVTKLLVNAGADLQATNGLAHTPLHLAADKGHVGVARELLKAGADPQATNALGHTPLLLAAERGHLEVLTALVKAGADLEAKNSDGFRSLHMAAQNGHLEVATALIEADADLAAKNVGGGTPLYLAAANGRSAVARALIDAGANPDARLPSGDTPLYSAATKGHLGVVKVLLRARANPLLTRTNPHYGTTHLPLDTAAHFGHAELVQELVQQLGIEGCGGASGGVDALFMAAQKQHVAVLAILVAAGVVDSGKALIVAAGGREDALTILLQQHERTSVNRAAYVNTRDRFGQNSLCHAICVGRCSPRVVRSLVDAGADTTLPVRVINTPACGVESNETPLDATNRCLRDKNLDGKNATEEQLQGLEGIRRLLIRVETVHALSWLWYNDAPMINRTARISRKGKITPIALGLILPVLRRGTRRRAVLLRALFRSVVVRRGWESPCSLC